MEQEILTKQEVEALLSCLEDENTNTTEEAKPMRNIDPEDVISQAEIDALLSGKPIEEPEINLPKDFQVRHEERLYRIQSAKDEVMSVMESLNIETQQLLQEIMSHDTNNEDWDGYEAQRVLGDCYAFLNECHAKLKKLDDLRLRENRLIKQLSTMVRSEKMELLGIVRLRFPEWDLIQLSTDQGTISGFTPPGQTFYPTRFYNTYGSYDESTFHDLELKEIALVSLDTLTSIKLNPKDLKYGKIGIFKKINRIQVYTSKGLMQWDVYRYGEDKPTADIEISFKQSKENDSMNEQKLTTEEEILRDMKLKDGFEKLMRAMLERDKPLTIKIKYHEDKYGELERLNRIEKGDWIDLRAAETVEMKQGEFKLISLGISMQFPPGYEAHMATRSSTYKTWGILLANSHSIIDESYNGDNDIWLFPALAMRDTVIKKGDRIAQFRLVKKMPAVNFEEVKTLGNPDRGGLGSTGKQ